MPALQAAALNLRGCCFQHPALLRPAQATMLGLRLACTHLRRDAATMMHRLCQPEGASSYHSSIGVDELSMPLQSREG